MFKLDENPPPYSSVVANPSVPSFESPDATLPFGRSDHLASDILWLVYQGKALVAHFRSICDVPDAKFEHQQSALALFKKFETLIWESRDVSGSVLVALKDFNEIVLNFLSKSEVAVEDRLRELGNTHKLLQQQRELAANNKSSFSTLVKELEEFHRMVCTESDAKRRKVKHSKGREARVARSSRNERISPSAMEKSDHDMNRSRKINSPRVIPRAEPSNALVISAPIGATPRNCMSSTLQFKRALEKSAALDVCSVSGASETMSGVPNPPERKRICPSIQQTTSVVSLPDVMGTLLRDLCSFMGRVDVFNTVFFELEREQGIFILYLKDGQSVGSLGYRIEVDRFRRQIPSLCNALDAYSKGKTV